MPIARPSRSTVSATALPSRTGVKTVRSTRRRTRSGLSVAAVVDLLRVGEDYVLELLARVRVRDVRIHLLDELVLVARRQDGVAPCLEALPAQHGGYPACTPTTKSTDGSRIASVRRSSAEMPISRQRLR